MRVLRCKPGEDWEEIEIDNTLEALQAEVDGYIETLNVFEDACFIVDEEGRLKGKPYCCSFLNIDMVGTVLLVGVDGEEFCDVPDGLVHRMVQWTSCTDV